MLPCLLLMLQGPGGTRVGWVAYAFEKKQNRTKLAVIKTYVLKGKSV